MIFAVMLSMGIGFMLGVAAGLYYAGYKRGKGDWR
jgi:hypothetical protein